MYKSPIDVLIEDVKMQVREGVDEQVHQAVVNVGINVDKKELLRALKYDRQQYEKGHADGQNEAMQHGMWIPVRIVTKKGHSIGEMGEKGSPELCSECEEIYMHAPYNYCPNCGAKMDLKPLAEQLQETNFGPFEPVTEPERREDCE